MRAFCRLPQLCVFLILAGDAPREARIYDQGSSDKQRQPRWQPTHVDDLAGNKALAAASNATDSTARLLQTIPGLLLQTIPGLHTSRHASSRSHRRHLVFKRRVRGGAPHTVSHLQRTSASETAASRDTRITRLNMGGQQQQRETLLHR